MKPWPKAVSGYFDLFLLSPIPTYIIAASIKFLVQFVFVWKQLLGIKKTTFLPVQLLHFFYHNESMTTCRSTVQAAYISMPGCRRVACTCTHRVVHKSFWKKSKTRTGTGYNYSRYPIKEIKEMFLATTDDRIGGLNLNETCYGLYRTLFFKLESYSMFVH